MTSRFPTMFVWVALLLGAACGSPTSGTQDPGSSAADVVGDAIATDHPAQDTSEADTPAMDLASPQDPGPSPDLLPPLPLRVEGRYIVDATGARVKLAGVNWAGAHLPKEVPDGLDKARVEDLAASIRRFGMNSVRLTFSNELVEQNAIVPDEAVAANPRLKGLRALDVLDATVAALAAEGLLVILNNHTSDSVWCCGDTDDNMLWYNDRYPEAAWIADWELLAKRYRDVPAVIGVDLRNEPRFPAQWGDALGPDFDWPSAAERCGNAVLAIDPDLIVFVEAVQYGKYLTGAKDRPVTLDVPDRLVYSSHDYAWFHDGADTAETIAADLRERWGFVLTDAPGPAPVWLGEFGTDADGPWFRAVVAWLAATDQDWCWWRAFADDDAYSLISAATLEPRVPALMEALSAVIPPKGDNPL